MAPPGKPRGGAAHRGRWRRTGGPRVLATLFRFEIRMLLRDRRTVLISVVVPVVLLPLILVIARLVDRTQQKQLNATTFAYAVTGPYAAWADSLVRKAAALTPTAGDSSLVPARFRRVRDPRPDSLLRAGDIQLVVQSVSAAQYRELRSRSVAGDTTAADSLAARLTVPVLLLNYRSDNDRSRLARRRLEVRLATLRERRRDDLLRHQGLPVDPRQVAALDVQNVASAGRLGGAVLGYVLTPLLVMLMLGGGSVVAADAISGEKERGTLETLLTTAATREEIVGAKQLAIMAVGVVITLIYVANLLLYLGIGLIQLPAHMALSVSPLSMVVILLLYLPLAAMISSGMLVASGYSRTFREFQIYFFPVFLLFLIPSLAAILPGLQLRSVIFLVPVANISVAVREALVGRFDWPFLVLTFAAATGAALLGVRVTSHALSVERLITAAELEQADLTGGPALFRKRVLLWYAVLWVALFLASLWFGEKLDIRVQVAFNLLVLFLGGAALMLWRYRLDPRQALALRPPRAPVWLAVLIGAPSGVLAATGVARISQHIFPVPERLIESFSQYLLPQDIPLWQIVLFLAILPGICEEIAFRGMLLHGLHKRLRPVPLALLVGIVFGLFHVSLFRLIPTAYLGVILAAVVLLTGSIFPAMLWHALNNATGLVPAELHWWPEVLPGWTALVGAAGLVVAFIILWRYRTPYPGLRTGRRRRTG